MKRPLTAVVHLMSEPVQGGQPQPAVEAVSSSASAGALLKLAREAQGLHIGALAVMLKVPVHKLEALESDRFDELLDMVFTRALAASVCRALKIDPAAVLAALPQSEIRRVKTSAANLNTPFKSAHFGLGQQLKTRLASPLSFSVGLLVLGIFVMLLWPDLKSPEAVTRDEVTPETQASQVTAPALPAMTASMTAPGETTALSLAAPDQAAPVQETDVNPGAATAGATALLILQSRGTSWAEVIDANGVVQLRKIMEPGEVLQVDGALPLSVVLGRAGDMDVSVRGQRLDLPGMTKDNVARFEVK